MERKGLNSICRGDSREAGGTDGQEDETAQIRIRPPYSRKDLIISQKVMKNMCTSLTCDVCEEPAEVRCNCCKLLFCSTLCLLKSEPKHKIVCETSTTATQKNDLEYLCVSSSSGMEQIVPSKSVADVDKDRKLLTSSLPSQSHQNDVPPESVVDVDKDRKLLTSSLPSQSVPSKSMENCEKEVIMKSNLENKTPQVHPRKGFQPIKPISSGQNSSWKPATKFVGNSKSATTDASRQEINAHSLPAQDEVKKSPMTNFQHGNAVPCLPKTVFQGNQAPVRTVFQGNQAPMRKTSFSGVKTEEEVTMPPTPPLTPVFKPVKISTDKLSQGMPSSAILEKNQAAVPSLPVQKEPVAPTSKPDILLAPSSQKLTAPPLKVMPGQNECHLMQTLKAINDSDHFTQVQIVTTEEEDIYWVLDLESYDKTFAFDEEIRSRDELPILYPKLNLWCCVRHDSDWYRAVIIELVPLTVFLMDIGIVKVVKSAFQLPESLCNDPPMAVKVWAKDAPPEYLNLPIGTPIMIRGVGEFPEGLIVEVKGAFYVNCGNMSSENNDTKSPRDHILDKLYSCDLSFRIRINKTVGSYGLIGSIIVEDAQEKLPCYTDCDSMLSLLSHSSPDPGLRPEINDLVSAKLGDLWYRGLVFHKSKEDVKVALIDYGLIVQPQAMCALPNKLGDQCPTAVRLNFEWELVNISDLVGEQLKGSLSKDGCITFDIGTADIVPWVAGGEDFPESVFPVYSGMSVTLTTHFRTDLIYIQPADCPEMYTFLEAVNTHSQFVPEMTKKPFCGDLVACAFSPDKVFYRAKILKQNGSKLEVFFVDFGNTETVDMKDVKELPTHFKTVPYYAIKIGLAQLIKSDLTAACLALLKHFMCPSIKLKLEIENSLDSVILLTPDGDSLNSGLEELLAIDSSLNFTQRNLSYEKFCVGQEIQMAIVQISEKNNAFAMDLNSEYGMTEVLDNFTAQLSLYCSDHRGGYEPKLGEVFCAKYADEGGSSWYRAISTKIFKDSCEVFFVDYGNFEMVKLNDICPIGRDFMTHPVPVKEFIIYGMNVFSEIEKREIIGNMTGKVVQATVINDAGHKAMVYVPSLNPILKQYKKPEINMPPLCF